jgi:lysyl-tRNA synthetase class 1
MLEPPGEPEAHIQYNLMLNLANVAPIDNRTEFIKEKLESYGNLKEGDKGLYKRIEYAVNWIEDFGEPKIQKISLSEKEATAVIALVEALIEISDESDYQSAVFEVARAQNIHPREFFQLLYRILLGRPQGPRFGPFVVTMGKGYITKKLEEYVRN